MITVLVSIQKYPLSSSKIEKELARFLQGHGVQTNAQVSVAIVDEKTMLNISTKYLKDHAIHDVLSFPANEIKGEFVSPPDAPHQLGEIIVCFEMALEEAKEEGIPIERKVIELIQHGALHLLGIHHE